VRRLGLVALGVLFFSCKPSSTPAPQTQAPPVASVAPPRVAVPDDVRERLPELSGALSDLPFDFVRVTLRRETIDVGDTSVTTLEEGWIGAQGHLDLARAMTVAGSPNRPIALFVDADALSRTVLDVVEAATVSGGSVVGLVARERGGALGWIPVRAATMDARGVSTIRLETSKDWAAVSDQAWSHADGVHRLTVGVPDFMPAQALFDALHQLRGPRCADEPGSCRFASLGLATNETVLGEPGKMGKPVVKVSTRFDADGRPIESGMGGLGLVGTGRGGGGTGEGSIGLGNTGLIGKGGGGGTGSGYGRGSGAGFGGNGKRVPKVRQAKATVAGGLDKDIIRRIVRAHINEVRHCYNQGLVKDPDLSGRVRVKFKIVATGKVGESSVESTTLPDTDVAECVAKAFKRWKFPKPRGGGEVDVSYPFVLSPD
jgi:hypothetical protein